jgi:radical SAM superfamily enzyme YgiQ (UPF0313 family)
MMTSRADGPIRAVLVSTYELGHQPFWVASPTAWLKAAGASVVCVDLAVAQWDDDTIRAADLVAFYLPMHTATRIAAQWLPRVRELNPAAFVCAYGLYAPMNADLLRDLGARVVIGGEFEEPLCAVVTALARGDDDGDTAAAVDAEWGRISLRRQDFLVPDRAGLPPLSSYAYLTVPDGTRRVVGYTEATRGCKHLCRHCPVVPIYGGRFRVVPPDVVLADVEQQVAAGAQHVTFGDPDFLNGPAHAVRVIRGLHERFPELTYDVTIKIEHLVNHRELLPVLRETGCALITSAVEAVDERILEIFDKHHTRADFAGVVAALREVGIPLNPTFVAFTPWTSLAGYLDFLDEIRRLGLVANVAPVQYAIRLLIPEGSKLLELPDVVELVGPFDREKLCYSWVHTDPRVDALQQEIFTLVQKGAGLSRAELFTQVWRAAADRAGRRVDIEVPDETVTVPQLSEPWYCCAEPTELQLAPPV